MAADAAAASPEETLAALLREAAALKQRLSEENNKLNDVPLFTAAERLEPISLAGLKLRRVLKGHQSKVLCFDWSPDKRHIASSAQDGRLLIWDAFAAAREHAVPTGSPWALACAYAPNGTLIAAGGLDNKVTLWAADGGGERRAAATQAAYVAAVAFPRSARQLLTAGGDGTVALWDVEAGTQLHAYCAHACDALTLHVAPGAGSAGDVFASGGADRAALVWDARAPQPVHAFTTHGSDVTGVRFHPGGDALATACDDAAVRLFDLRADRSIARYAKDSLLFPCSSVEWSAAGRILFAGYGDHTAAAWDALRGTRLLVLCGHDHRVSRVQLAPDSTALATASWDATIRIWA